MKKTKLSFGELPKNLKIGLILIVLAWTFYLISGSVYTGQISLVHSSMGMFVCYAAFSLKNWGRIFTVIYDSFMAIMIAVELYYIFNNGSLTSETPLFIKVTSITLFTVSSIFLLSRESVNIYKGKTVQI